MGAMTMPLNIVETAFGELPGRILKPSDPEYQSFTVTWARQKNLHPQLLVRPQSIGELRELVKVLYHAEPAVDFAVRNGGIGSSSSRDVLISLDHFKSMQFVEDEEILYVGAGALWEDVDSYMEQNASGWAVVSSRTPCVGVTGIITVGGVSWLSHELGLVSDPKNLLDAEVILADGRHVWASENDQDLLWSLRGGRSVFGVVTRLKLRTHRVKTAGIFSGQIRFPLDKLQEVSEKIAQHVERNHDPKVALHCFILNPKSPFFDSPPGVAIMVYDGNGIEHGRGPEGFQWALAIEGAEDQTVECSFYDVNKQSDKSCASHSKFAIGMATCYDVSGLVSDIDANFVVRASNWCDKVLRTNERFASGSYCLIELFQSPVYSSSERNTAWPHSGHKHILQLGVGFSPGSGPDLSPQCLDLLNEAFATIPKTPLMPEDFAPNFWEPSLMTVEGLYGPNLARMRDVAAKYDPKTRFRSIFNPQK